jgi:hypothetical protein
MAKTPSLLTGESAIEREIISLREKAELIAGELSLRARGALDIRTQLRKWTWPLLAVGATVVLVAGAGVALTLRRRRLARAPTARVRRKLSALGQLMLAPEAVIQPRQREEDPLRRLLIGLLATAVSVSAKMFVKRYVPRPG